VILAIVFAHVWGILQLIVLGSFARTVRVRTTLAAMAAGLYACAPVAVLLELAWTRPVASVTGAPLSDIMRMASYTTDPFMEEFVKVLPLAILLVVVRVIRRQWSITDCVLVGAALGSGFGLAEDLYRFSAAPANAVWIGGGWLVRPNFATIVTVPSPLTTVTSWLPAGAVSNSLFSFLSRAPHPVDLHLALSAIGGFAVGLLLQHRASVSRRAGVLLLLYLGFDHAVYNAALQVSAPRALVVLSSMLQELLRFLPVVALIVAWWLDRQRQNTETIPELALAAETTISPPVVGTLRTALSRAPWSVAWVDALVRMRRAYASAGPESGAEDRLRKLIVDLRDRIDRAVAQSGPLPITASSWTRAYFAWFRQPKVIVLLVMITPSILWFVVGGFPTTALLQQALAWPPAWTMIRVISAAAFAWTAWNVFVSIRLWVQAVQLPLADFPATFALGLLSGVGAVALGGYVFVLSVTGSPHARVISSIHASNAMGNLNVMDGLILAALGAVVAVALLSGVGELLAAGGVVGTTAAASGGVVGTTAAVSGGVGATLGTAGGLGTFGELGGVTAALGAAFGGLGQSQMSGSPLPDAEVIIDPDADPFGGTLVPGLELPPGEVPSDWPEGVDPWNPKLPKPPKVPVFDDYPIEQPPPKTPSDAPPQNQGGDSGQSGSKRSKKA